MAKKRLSEFAARLQPIPQGQRQHAATKLNQLVRDAGVESDEDRREYVRQLLVSLARALGFEGAAGFVTHRVVDNDAAITLFAGLWDALKLDDRGADLAGIAAHAARVTNSGRRVEPTPDRGDEDENEEEEELDMYDERAAPRAQTVMAAAARRDDYSPPPAQPVDLGALQRMIAEAVAAATAPLHAEIARLSASVAPTAEAEHDVDNDTRALAQHAAAEAERIESQAAAAVDNLAAEFAAQSRAQSERHARERDALRQEVASEVAQLRATASQRHPADDVAAQAAAAEQESRRAAAAAADAATRTKQLEQQLAAATRELQDIRAKTSAPPAFDAATSARATAAEQEARRASKAAEEANARTRLIEQQLAAANREPTFDAEASERAAAAEQEARRASQAAEQIEAKLGAAKREVEELRRQVDRQRREAASLRTELSRHTARASEPHPIDQAVEQRVAVAETELANATRAYNDVLAQIALEREKRDQEIAELRASAGHASPHTRAAIANLKRETAEAAQAARTAHKAAEAASKQTRSPSPEFSSLVERLAAVERLLASESRRQFTPSPSSPHDIGGTPESALVSEARRARLESAKTVETHGDRLPLDMEDLRAELAQLPLYRWPKGADADKDARRAVRQIVANLRRIERIGTQEYLDETRRAMELLGRTADPSEMAMMSVVMGGAGSDTDPSSRLLVAEFGLAAERAQDWPRILRVVRVARLAPLTEDKAEFKEWVDGIRAIPGQMLPTSSPKRPPKRAAPKKADHKADAEDAEQPQQQHNRGRGRGGGRGRGNGTNQQNFQ